ncbi:helix-turn-helix domain-containing protein [Pendulispora albinea]|uniref:Uncharacterized protein n=1 Tax=Pendulispora albinea TaxID=2741071 RepID=A0ABZ2LLA4_9BACT
MIDPLLDDLLSGESSRVEWKETGTDAKKVLRAVSALANDLEGSGK